MGVDSALYTPHPTSNTHFYSLGASVGELCNLLIMFGISLDARLMLS